MTTLDVLCIGHAAYDLTLGVAHHPDRDEKMQADRLDCAGGGPAANAAVAVCRLGGNAGFCGYLGLDVYGQMHASEFAAVGADTRFAVRGDHPTPLSAILAKPDGTRSVVNYKAETPWLEPGIMDSLPEIDAKVLLFDGHEPLISEPMVGQARARGIPTVLDAGSVHQGTRELAPLVDYLVGSERFARDWAGTDDMDKALKALSEVTPNVVITLGSAGLIWTKNGVTGQVPAFEVDAIDSTGAGDAFHGAFALGLARAMEWNALLRYAAAVGALACTKLGARSGIPDGDAVQLFLDSH